MTSLKKPLGVNVLTAAQRRISYVFDKFSRIYLSFSGGKDSTVMLHLVMEEAIRRHRRVGLLFVDLEAQYRMTIEHVVNCVENYREHIDLHWIALPITLRNAVSQFQPKWEPWSPDARDLWVRPPDPRSITNLGHYPWFRRGMEFEELVPAFGDYFADGEKTACFVGIRADESLNRFRSIVRDKARFDKLAWTTVVTQHVVNIYPIYDWKTEDIWTWHAKNSGALSNPLYDRMHRAGLSIHQARICQPYGDDQRRGLWLYHVIEPETWGRVVARVNGANSGALYVTETGSVSGVGNISKPEHLTWEGFAKMLLSSMPPSLAEHYRNKIAVFLKWYADRGFPHGIPDSGPVNTRDHPSWARICKALLRNDYWMKGLSFTQTKTEAFERYKALMEKRRKEWGVI